MCRIGCFSLLLLLLVGRCSGQCLNWVNVGSPGFSNANASKAQIAIDTFGLPLVSYSDASLSSKAMIQKFSGTSWAPYHSTGGLTYGGTNYNSFAISKQGKMFLAFQDFSNASHITVMCDTGNGWWAVGGPASAGIGSQCNIATGINDTPYVAFTDNYNFSSLTVAKWTGSGWYPLGTPGFSFGVANYPSIAIDPAGMPYVAFCHQAIGDSVVVVKWNGSSWVNVGNSAISGPASYSSLAIDNSGIPYVAFVDGTNLNKVTVMKFSGSSWSPVGSPAFSPGIASFLSMALDVAGTPYVTFKDDTNGGGVTAMRFDGLNWNLLGSPSFSPGQVVSPSITVDKTGTPFVAYVDLSNNNKVNVQKLQSSLNVSIPSNVKVCLGSVMGSIPFTAVSGTTTGFNISWNNAALNAGFVNVSNGTITGSAIPVSIPPNVSAGTYYATVTFSSGVCQSNSVPVSITLQPSVIPQLTITGRDTICNSQNDTFTVLSNVSGMTYMWQRNGVNVTSGSTYTFTPANGDIVRCIGTTPAGCFNKSADTSNSVTMSVLPFVYPTVSISGMNNICSGTSVTYVASTNFSKAHYQWQVNGSNMGTDSINFTYAPYNSNTIRCIVSVPANGCFLKSHDTSNTIIASVVQTNAPYITVSAGANNVCAGSTVTFGANGNIPTGSYQWLVNAAAAGSNSSTFSYVPLNGDVVSCVLIAPAGCYYSPTDTSNTVVMNVTPNVVPMLSVTSDTNNVCSGTTVFFYATIPIQGCSYEWWVNSSNTFASQSMYSMIPQNGDIISCRVTLPQGCFIVSSLSDSVTMNIMPSTTPSIILNGPTSAVPGTIITLNAVLNNAGSNFNIVWKNRGMPFDTTSVPSVTFSKGAGADTVTAHLSLIGPGCYTNANSNAWIINSTVSVSNPIQNDMLVKLYPNPFSDEIVIDGLIAENFIKVYDVNGRPDGTFSSNGTRLHIQTKHYAPGIYSIVVVDKNGRLIRQFTLEKIR